MEFYHAKKKAERQAAGVQGAPDKETPGPSGGGDVDHLSKRARLKGKSLVSGVCYSECDLDGFTFDSSSDEEGGPGAPRQKTEADWRGEDFQAAKTEFPRVFKNWIRYSVDYAREFPNSNLVCLTSS